MFMFTNVCKPAGFWLVYKSKTTSSTLFYITICIADSSQWTQNERQKMHTAFYPYLLYPDTHW